MCSSFSAEACAILQAYRWSWWHQQDCHFSPLISFFLLAKLSSPTFLLSHTFWHTWQELSFLSFSTVRLQWVPCDSFLPEKANKLVKRGALLQIFTGTCSFSFYKSYLLFFQTDSSKFFDTHDIPLRTCLLRRARYVLSRLRYKGHILLLYTYLSKSCKIKNPSYSSCSHLTPDTLHLILHCPATDSAPVALW